MHPYWLQKIEESRRTAVIGFWIVVFLIVILPVMLVMNAGAYPIIGAICLMVAALRLYWIHQAEAFQKSVDFIENKPNTQFPPVPTDPFPDEDMPRRGVRTTPLDETPYQGFGSAHRGMSTAPTKTAPAVQRTIASQNRSVSPQGSPVMSASNTTSFQQAHASQVQPRPVNETANQQPFDMPLRSAQSIFPNSAAGKMLAAKQKLADMVEHTWSEFDQSDAVPSKPKGNKQRTRRQKRNADSEPVNEVVQSDDLLIDEFAEPQPGKNMLQSGHFHDLIAKRGNAPD